MKIRVYSRDVTIADQSKYMRYSGNLELLYDLIRLDWAKYLETDEKTAFYIHVPVCVHEKRMRVIMTFVELIHRYGGNVYLQYRNDIQGVLSDVHV